MKNRYFETTVIPESHRNHQDFRCRMDDEVRRDLPVESSHMRREAEREEGDAENR